MRLARIACLPLMLFASLAVSAQSMAPHPRLLLDANVMDHLHAGVDPDNSNGNWTRLKHVCDSYIGGTVNLPDGAAFPSAPNIGQGNEGQGYWNALMSEGVCYQSLLASDPTHAATYGAKARDILLAMSTPYTGPGSHGQDPCNVEGYGIRYYGPGMGIGYDWLFSLLSTTDQQQVYTTANAWLASYASTTGCAATGYSHPVSTSYAGYFHANAAIALATYDENPSAPALWNQWLNTEFYGNTGSQPHIGVQPYFATHLAGGGWPGGVAAFGEGKMAVLNMTLPMVETLTATGVDLVNSSSAPYKYPVDIAEYLQEFTRPSFAFEVTDDRDTVPAITGANAEGTDRASAGLYQGAAFAASFFPQGDGLVKAFIAFNGVARQRYDKEPWEAFFYNHTPQTPTQNHGWFPWDLPPLSYFAPGLNAVAARNGGGRRGILWMSFRAGPYVGNPALGEEGFDQGSLSIVRDGKPLLVNGTGQIVRPTSGLEDEKRLNTDLFGDFNGSVQSGNRTLYNIFYVRRMAGNRVLDPYGQDAYTAENPPRPNEPMQAGITRYENAHGYTYALATHLYDMYRRSRVGAPQVSEWAREIVFMNSYVVVYDRTREGDASDDQFMAFHFASQPVAGTAPSGSQRFNISSEHGRYAGAMTSVLPANATMTTTGMFPANNADGGSKPVKVWQMQVRPPDTGVSQKWLTVFDGFPNPANVGAASAITMTRGNAVGTLLAQSVRGNIALLFNTGVPSSTIGGTIAYSVPAAATTHVVTEVAASAKYHVDVVSSGGNHQVSIVPSPTGSLTSSAKGVLFFKVAANGTVSAN